MIHQVKKKKSVERHFSRRVRSMRSTGVAADQAHEESHLESCDTAVINYSYNRVGLILRVVPSFL
jgi:hypothetical protein